MKVGDKVFVVKTRNPVLTVTKIEQDYSPDWGAAVWCSDDDGGRYFGTLYDFEPISKYGIGFNKQ